MRGQVVYLSQVGLERWYLDSSADLTYVVPRSHDIVVGGTDQEGEWSRTPSPDDAEAILARARRLGGRRWSARAVLRHGSGCAPLARRYGWSGSASAGVPADGTSVRRTCYGHGGCAASR